MKLVSRLEDLGIGISGKDVLNAFQPFVSGNPEESWSAAVRRRWIRALRGAALRCWRLLLGRGKRDRTFVKMEYEKVWSTGHVRYDLATGTQRLVPWTFRDQPLMGAMAGAARFRSLILGAVIRTLKPRRVLEVGCGDGINLLLLAGAFPEIAFAGIDLTTAGINAARELQSREVMPAHLAAYAPLPQKDLAAFRRIDFRQGDACRLPFDARAFDLVLTILSVEQMESVRDSALTEIARVTGKFLLNMEPFANMNPSGLQRLHVFNRNYFRGRIEDLPRYGLEVEWASSDFPQEVYLGAALVLSRKKSFHTPGGR